MDPSKINIRFPSEVVKDQLKPTEEVSNKQRINSDIDGLGGDDEDVKE